MGAGGLSLYLFFTETQKVHWLQNTKHGIEKRFSVQINNVAFKLKLVFMFTRNVHRV